MKHVFVSNGMNAIKCQWLFYMNLNNATKALFHGLMLHSWHRNRILDTFSASIFDLDHHSNLHCDDDNDFIVIIIHLKLIHCDFWFNTIELIVYI